MKINLSFLILFCVILIKPNETKGQVACTVTPTSCNLIQNPGFENVLPGAPIASPFNASVPFWSPAYGSPQVTTPGFLSGVMARMWAGDGTSGEGIFQNLATCIEPNRVYWFSIDFSHFNSPAPNNNLDLFRVFLAQTGNSNIPGSVLGVLPAVNQVIINQTNIVNAPNSIVFNTLQNCFTANNAFDQIVLHPQDANTQQWVTFDNLDLRRLAFAGLDQIANCCDSIGPDCAIPGATYTWSSLPVDPNLIANQANQIVCPQFVTTYFLTVTSPDGSCTDSDTVVITPQINLDVLPVLATGCVGDTVVACLSVLAGGPYTFDWGSGSSTSACTTVVITSPGNITIPVDVTSPNGCTATIFAPVQSLLTPIIHIAPYTPACAGDSVQLYATTNVPDQIIWTGSGGVIPGNPITVNPTTSTTYTATVTNSFGCTDTETVTVVPLPGPTTFFTDIWVCQNEGIIPFFHESKWEFNNDIYSVTGVSSPTPPPFPLGVLGTSMPNVTHTFNTTGLTPGDYVVEVCYNTGTECCTFVTFHVAPAPVLSIPDFTPCQNDPPFVMHPIPLPNGVVDINYYGNTNGINETTHVFNPGIATIGTHNFTVCYELDNGDECCSTYTIVVKKSPKPLVTSLPITVCENDPPFQIANETSTLMQVVAPFGFFGPNFNVSGAADAFFTASPSVFPGLTSSLTGQVMFDPDPANLGDNFITYTVITADGCDASITGVITVCPEPVISLNVIGDPCLSPLSLTIDASIGIMPADCPVISFSWTGPGSFTAVTEDILVTTAGTYTLTVITEACTTSQSITVGSNVPSLTISSSDPQPCLGDNVTLNANSFGTFVNYEWTYNSNPYASGNFPSITATLPGVYCVIGTDANGCISNTSCITINFISVPPINIVGTTNICEGDDIDLSIGLGGNCSSPSAQWFANGTLIGSGPALFIPANTFPAGTIITVEVCCGDCCDKIQVAIINKVPSVSLTPVSIDLCAWDGNPIQLIGISDGTNCEYSGSLGIIDPVLGLFDPIAAGGEGTYAVSFTCELNGCFATATEDIVVTENDYWHQTTFNAIRDIGNDVITDADGNVYITGLYTRQTSFHGGNNVDVPIASGGGASAFSFIAKYDNCANLMWVAHAKSGPTGQPNYGTSITLDEVNGLVYASGNFIDEIYYSEGWGSFGTVIPPVAPISVFTSSPSNRGYVISLNMSDGAIHSLDPIVIDDKTYAEAITINETSGDIYVGGFRNGSLNPGQDFMYIRKYTPTPVTIGAFIWEIPGTGDGSHYVNDMAFDETGSANGDLWVIGDYKVELILSGNIISTPANMDAYIARIEDGTPSVVLLKTGNMPAGGNMEGNGIAIDQINHKAFVTGTYDQGIANVFLTPDNLVNISGFNAYFMGFDQAGTEIWSDPNIGEAGTLQAHGKAAAFQNGNAYFTGWFNGNTSFNGNIPVPATMNYTGTSMLHTYAVGFDASNGAGTWSNNTIDPAGTAFHNGNAIATDNFGHAYITGGYMNEMGYNAGTPASGNLISTSLTPFPAVNAFTMRVQLSNGDFKNMLDASETNEIQLAEGDITVFPNPTNGKLNIKIASTLSDQSQVEVYSLDGRLVLKNQISSNQTEIDMSELQTGLYLVRVLNGNDITSFQVIKAD